jgi:hypothetical protein
VVDLPNSQQDVHDKNSICARSWAGELVARLQNDENAGQNVQALTADEADLLESPRRTYEPWVVPLTARPNSAPIDAATDEMDGD